MKASQNLMPTAYTLFFHSENVNLITRYLQFWHSFNGSKTLVVTVTKAADDQGSRFEMCDTACINRYIASFFPVGGKLLTLFTLLAGDKRLRVINLVCLKVSGEVEGNAIHSSKPWIICAYMHIIWEFLFLLTTIPIMRIIDKQCAIYKIRIAHYFVGNRLTFPQKNFSKEETSITPKPNPGKFSYS